MKPYTVPFERRIARSSFGSSGSMAYRDAFPSARRLDAPKADRVGIWIARHGGQLVVPLLAALLGLFIGLALGTPS